MQFEYSDHEYRTECLDGCGALTAWVQSRMAADQAGINHETAQCHGWAVCERMKQKEGEHRLYFDPRAFSSLS
jgi:hypothetical protein